MKRSGFLLLLLALAACATPSPPPPKVIGDRDPASAAAACDPWLRGERSREEALQYLVVDVGKPKT